jgi:transposase
MVSWNYLSAEQKIELKRQHRQIKDKRTADRNIVTKSKQIISFIHESFGVKYTASGIKAFLHKNGFSYKQLIKFNSKTDEEAQLKIY